MSLQIKIEQNFLYDFIKVYMKKDTYLIFRYNERYGTDGIHEKLTWEDVEDKVQEFKEKYIYPTIVNKEVEEESMLWWIQNKLARHSYDDADNYYESDDEADEDEKQEPEMETDVKKGNESVMISNLDESDNKVTASS